jgi:5-methylcytosine-specific restriction protein A
VKQIRLRTRHQNDLTNNAFYFTCVVCFVLTVMLWCQYLCPPHVEPVIVVEPETTQEIQESVDAPPIPTVGAARSGKWQAVKRHWIKLHPVCEACGTTAELNVHHIKPFHTHPELELDLSNLVTLCRTHHFIIGHDPDGPWKPAKPSWETANPNVLADAKKWKTKL